VITSVAVPWFAPPIGSRQRQLVGSPHGRAGRAQIPSEIPTSSLQAKLFRGARNAINKICQAAGVKAHELIDADAAAIGNGA
jgi:hypothetical protein